MLEAFDAGGAPVHVVSYTDGTAGLFGGVSELGFLGIASDVPIVHARFSRYWNQQISYGFEIDDLRFMPGQPTPALGTTWGHIKSIYH